MVNALIEFFKKNNFDLTIKVKDLKNSCCFQSNIIVYDCNAIKTKICQVLNCKNPKSVNAILFTKTESIVFLQTESYYAKNLFDELNQNEIQDKIIGTIEVLSNLISHYKLAKDFPSFFSKHSICKKIETNILVSISDEDYLKIRLGNLDKLNIKTDNAIIGEIKLMSCEDFERING